MVTIHIPGEVSIDGQCARKDCEFEAQWTPIIVIPKNIEKRQGRGKVYINNHDVCQSHMESLRIGDFFQAGAYEIFKFQLKVVDKHPPAQEDLVLEWSRSIRAK